VAGARHAHVRPGCAEAAAGGPHRSGEAEPRPAAAASLVSSFSADRCARAASLGQRQLLGEQHVPRGRDRRVREELHAPRRDVAHERGNRLRSHDGGAVNALGRGPLRSARHPPAVPTHRDGRRRQSRHAGALVATHSSTRTRGTRSTVLATHARGGGGGGLGDARVQSGLHMARGIIQGVGPGDQLVLSFWVLYPMMGVDIAQEVRGWAVVSHACGGATLS
jgi:hypothetical protein